MLGFLKILVSVAFSASSLCSSLLIGLSETDATTRFLHLLEHLVLEKRAVTRNDLVDLVNSRVAVEPTLKLSNTENYTYGAAFRALIQEGRLDWSRVQLLALKLSEHIALQSSRTGKADEERKGIFFPFLLKRDLLPKAEVIYHIDQVFEGKGGLGINYRSESSRILGFSPDGKLVSKFEGKNIELLETPAGNLLVGEPHPSRSRLFNSRMHYVDLYSGAQNVCPLCEKARSYRPRTRNFSARH